MDFAIAIGYIVFSIALSCILYGGVWIATKILLGASCLFTRRLKTVQGRSKQPRIAPDNIDREHSE